MAGWTAMNQKLNPGGLDLMQNCDLPPPLNVFSGKDITVLSSTNRIWTILSGQDDDNDNRNLQSGAQNEKLELLKALRLSQTRAREAEKKAARLIKERDAISNALLKESSNLFAYRQLVKLLELQVSKLQRQHQQEVSAKEDDGKGAGNMTWLMALALCLGIAGVGFRYS